MGHTVLQKLEQTVHEYDTLLHHDVIMWFYLGSHINKFIFQHETSTQGQRSEQPFLKLLSI